MAIYLSKMMQLRNITPSSQQKWWDKIHIVAAVGFFIRIIVALRSEQIHHPDEIFQYLEQSHRLVFQYGYIPWEYRFGIRSWLLPGFLSLLLLICRLLRLDDPNVYIPFVKVILCAISVSLIYSAYIIGRNIASETVGRFASLLTCFWYELIYFSSRPTPEVLSTYLVMAALGLATLPLQRQKPILSGFLCALAGILRFQYCPTIAILLLYQCLRWRKKEVLASGLTVMLAIVFAGYIDHLTLGKFFVSYYNNYLFNSVYKVSEVFGTEPPAYFLENLMICSVGIFPITIILGLTRIKKIGLLCLCASTTVFFHSLIAHKEHRFIFLVIPICLIITAVILADGVLPYQSKNIGKKILSYLLAAFILITSIGSSFLIFPLQNIYIKTAFGQSSSIVSQQAILKAYLLLFKQSDLVAILNTFSPWYQTGGYYYLHRDIPIYFPEQLKQIDREKIGLYVSHIVCHFGDATIPNFVSMYRIGDLEIRKQIYPPATYESLSIDTKNILQPEVDGRYKPMIKPLFH